MNELKLPVVGVATLIFKQGKLLLGQRKKTPGYKTWQCPGGLLQANEAIFDCARREVLEETGMAIHNLNYGPYSNNIFLAESEHSVTLYVTAETDDEPRGLEPHLAEDWQWFEPGALPQPLFLPLDELLKHHRSWLESVAKGA